MNEDAAASILSGGGKEQKIVQSFESVLFSFCFINLLVSFSWSWEMGYEDFVTKSLDRGVFSFHIVGKPNYHSYTAYPCTPFWLREVPD